MKKFESFDLKQAKEICEGSNTFTEMAKKFGYVACPKELKEDLIKYAQQNSFNIQNCINHRNKVTQKKRLASSQNLIGQKFGHLTVIEEDLSLKGFHNRRYWKCQCDCYKKGIIICNTSDLRRGRKTHCEYCPGKNTEDLRGHNFGKLTPLYIDRDRILKEQLEGKQHRTYWICKCNCGDFTSVEAHNLKTYKVYSCGCIKSIGENQIEEILKTLKCNYKTQVSFDQLCGKGNKKLRFDFGIYDKNNKIICLLEYNGKQHYEKVDYFGGQSGFENQQLLDKLKIDYCQKNNIPLYIIKYNEKITQDLIIKILEQKIINST